MTSETKGLKIGGLVEKDSPSHEEIDNFIHNEGPFPIVERYSVTFVYRGEADEVHLRHWVFGLASTQAFTRVGRSDLWFLVLELPPESRVEYKFEVVQGDQHRLIEDPLNDQKAHDPFGSNSVVQGEGYEFPEWAMPNEETRPGSMKDFSFHSPAFGDERHVTLYTPARFRATRAYPLLVVHDGGDYVRFSQLKVVLDNLIHRLEIPSMVVALTHPKKRLNEYANEENHARFITEELVPRLSSQLPLIDDPSGRGIMGASFGAVASFSTAVRYPGFFGRVLLQSGSFAFTDIGTSQRGPAFDPVVEFVNNYRASPKRFTDRLFVSCGMYESLIYENRSLVPI
ncbi:MAG: enterochelin esterase, partial [Candidatus Eisenbacteria bacterium]|nr:enterochelin esterase [Candidatus Eisenbacteria bacterium]